MGKPTFERLTYINLPHARTVLGRIDRWFGTQPEASVRVTALPRLIEEIDRILRPYLADPPDAEAVEAADRCAVLARRLIEEIERAGFRGDRLGQCVRNLFECFGLAAEGAELSLRCGERPDSPLRP